MDIHSNWRLTTRAALETYFRDRSFPRLTLGLLVSFAGVSGFLISYIFLRLGMLEMWERYPLAVVGGYSVFLLLLKLWVEIERSRFQLRQIVLSPYTPPETHEPHLKSAFSSYEENRSSWLDWFSCPSIFDLGDFFTIGFLIVLVLSLISACVAAIFTFVMAGSELIAEVFLDAVVVTMLYRNLKRVAKEHWLSTAVRRTWKPVLIVALTMSFLGGLPSLIAPSSHSLRQVYQEFLSTFKK
jgi:hypothetical protein